MRLERRAEHSAVWGYLSPVLALLLTVLSAAALFPLLGVNPATALYEFFVAPITSRYGLAELAIKATPLALIGCGLALGFRAGVWNIGAEGQLILGALAGGGLALAFYGEEGPWLLPLMALAGALGGMAWAAIPALLRTRFNANEILVSLLLTYVAVELLNYLVRGPWRDPDGFNFPESRLFNPEATLPIIVDGTRLNIAAPIAVVIVLGLWLVLARSLIGFQLKLLGESAMAARYAGFAPKRLVWISFFLSGGLAGLAGLFEVAGPIQQLQPSISPGYGFTAIIVAFLGRLHPFGVLLAALLMALTYLGGENLQISLGLPDTFTNVFQAVLLFYLLACDLLIRYRLVRRPSARQAA